MRTTVNMQARHASSPRAVMVDDRLSTFVRYDTKARQSEVKPVAYGADSHYSVMFWAWLNRGGAQLR